MNGRTEAVSKWVLPGSVGECCHGWFRVPKEPPSLPARAGKDVESFQPDPGFVRYLKLQFWIFLVLIDVGILVGWVVLTIALPLVGALLAIPALLIAVVPDVIAYLAIHLRYDTTCT